MKGKVTMKDLLRKGEVFVGTYLDTSSPQVLEAIAWAGMDYVVIDNEHGNMGLAETQNLVRIADGLGIACMIRVGGVDENEIKHALDSGCCGISVPSINSLEDAKKVVRYTRFAPLGSRGACPFTRANQFGLAYSSKEFIQVSNEDVTVLVALESPESLEEMEDIVMLPGIDVYAVGFYDLSVRMGIPGQTDDPRIVAAVDRIHELAHKHGKYAVITTFDYEEAKKCMTGRYKTDYITFSNDVMLITQGFKNMVDTLKGYRDNK